jgi:hypothetical protein
MRFPAIVAAVVATGVAIVLYPISDQHRLRSTDFVNFYAGASIVAQGDATSLYDRSVQGPLLQSISGLPLTEYFLHPPFEAAMLAVLALLPFRTAYVLWTALNAALVAALCWPFASTFQSVRRQPLIGMAGYFFFPVLVSLVLGQDSVFLLAILVVTYVLMRDQRPFLAGLVLSLSAIKFQYLLIFTCLLLMAGKRRLVLGAASGCVVLALISAVLVGLPGLISYVILLRDFSAHSGYGSLHLDLMVNWRGFLAGLGISNRAFFMAGEIGLALIAFAATQIKRDESLQFAVLLTVSLLASPYAHFADATLLLLPVLIVIDRAATRRRIALLIVTAALFVVPPMLLLFGGHYWWNSHIYLVFLVALMFLLVVSAELYSPGSAAPALD